MITILFIIIPTEHVNKMVCYYIIKHHTTNMLYIYHKSKVNTRILFNKVPSYKYDFFLSTLMLV